MLNIYYTDDENPILTGIGPGDSSIINLAPNEYREFKLQTGVNQIIILFIVLMSY